MLIRLIGEGFKRLLVSLLAYLAPHAFFATLNNEQILEIQDNLILLIIVSIATLLLVIQSYIHLHESWITGYEYLLMALSSILGILVYFNVTEIVLLNTRITFIATIISLLIVSGSLIIYLIFRWWIFIQPSEEKHEKDNHDDPIKSFDELKMIRGNDKELFKELEKNINNILERRINNESTGVICIDGAWGSGKTSFVNLLEDKSKNPDKDKIVSKSNVTWYRFDTMHYTNYTELTNDFFHGLMLHLEKNFGIFLRSEITQIATLLSPFIEKNFYFDIKSLLLGGRDLKQLKARISEKLNNSKDKKLVIVIDDIDRLYPEDVLSIFKLIKFLSDLPNVIIITPFDYNKVNNIIVEKYKKDYNGYIDKIVNYRIRLVPYSYEELRSVFKNEFIKRKTNLTEIFDVYKVIFIQHLKNSSTSSESPQFQIIMSKMLNIIISDLYSNIGIRISKINFYPFIIKSYPNFQLVDSTTFLIQIMNCLYLNIILNGILNIIKTSSRNNIFTKDGDTLFVNLPSYKNISLSDIVIAELDKEYINRKILDEDFLREKLQKSIINRLKTEFESYLPIFLEQERIRFPKTLEKLIDLNKLKILEDKDIEDKIIRNYSKDIVNLRKLKYIAVSLINNESLEEILNDANI